MSNHEPVKVFASVWEALEETPEEAGREHAAAVGAGDRDASRRGKVRADTGPRGPSVGDDATPAGRPGQGSPAQLGGPGQAGRPRWAGGADGDRPRGLKEREKQLRVRRKQLCPLFLESAAEW